MTEQMMTITTNQVLVAWSVGDTETLRKLANSGFLQLDFLDGDCLTDVMKIRAESEASGVDYPLH